jgi:hypothetical protein
MKTKIILILMLSHLSLSSSFVWSQKIVRSSIGTLGSSYKVNDVLVQSTVGQSSITTTETSGEGLVLRHGFQQPISIEAEQNDLNVLVYPNPSNGSFTFKTDISPNNLFTYSIFDEHGSVIESGTTLGNNLKEIHIADPKTGIYHLAVKSGKLHSSFKIILTK